jgi:hypothetical protein
VEALRQLQVAMPALLAGLDEVQAEFDAAMAAVPEVDFKEYDESVADEVQYCECPNCGHRFPK